jgi:uncharacterized membrane protein
LQEEGDDDPLTPAAAQDAAEAAAKVVIQRLWSSRVFGHREQTGSQLAAERYTLRPAPAGGANMDDMNAFKTLEPAIDSAIRMVGSGIEIFGVLVIVTGIAWSTLRQLRQPISEQDSDVYKIRIGRSLLLGLEVLVAADIVKTIAHELTFMSLGLLAGLVLVRTFLSWTLVLEIEGRWPWQREPSPISSRARP